MGIGKALLREKTLPPKKGTTTFYAPSVYVPVYGKTKHTVGGRGTPGNSPVPGNYAGTNASTGGNSAYNPSTGGNYAGTNPPTPGNVSGTNPSIPGNYAGTNPPTGGNASYNPTSGGNYAGTNPVIFVYNWSQVTHQNDTYGVIDPSVSPSSYYSTTGGPQGRPEYSTYTVINYSVPSQTVGYDQSNGLTYNSAVDPEYYAEYVNGNVYFSLYESWTFVSSSGGNAYYNPTTGGNVYYNPIVPGNPYTNPSTPGNPTYNPAIPGTAYYNPIVAGNLYYNPVVPGNDYYNPITPGNPGTPATVLGVSFPGGDVGSPGLLVSPTPVTINYDPAGVSITVPPGGYVDVINS